MKKKLEADLISIAHRILKLKGKEDVARMHAEVAELYEKLTVLKFAQENFEEVMPTIGGDSSFFGMLDTAFNNRVGDNIELDGKLYVNLDEKEEVQTRPLMGSIKELIAEMPEPTSEQSPVVETFETINTDYHKNDLGDIAGDYAQMPEFVPVTEQNTKRSLNDTLKSGLQIGLNDKLAFIKHLFNGSNADYERVLSQINTTTTFKDAQTLIQSIVKPDYNNWVGKEDFEERFMSIIEGKFN